MNGIQMLSLQLAQELGSIVADMIKKEPEQTFRLNIQAIIALDDGLALKTVDCVFMDKITGIVRVMVKDENDPLDWFFLSMSSQEMIANHLFLEKKTQELLNTIRMQ